MNSHTKTFSAPPSALSYMLLAILPSSGWDAKQGFPDLCMSWRNFRFDAQALDILRRLSSDTSPASENALSLLLPHVTGFRLLMAMLTHPAWPLPIWGALQVRNRLLLHRPLQVGDSFDLIADVAGWRVLEKGLEVDLHAKLQQGRECLWESIVTFYYRGRFGPAMAQGAALGAASNPPAIGDPAQRTTRWRVDGGGRWRFGALTGDFNGIHQWNWYARRFGFHSAFAHPQRIAAQCLAHLPSPGAAPQRLDLWIRGPVFFGGEALLRLVQRAAGEGSDFALWIDGDARPALIGSHSLGMAT